MRLQDIPKPQESDGVFDYVSTGEKNLMIAIVERASLDAMGVGCDQAEQIEARRWFFCDTPSPEGLTAHRVFSFLELDLTDFRSSLWAAMLYRRSPLAQKVVSHQRVRAYRNIKLKKNRNSGLCIK